MFSQVYQSLENALIKAQAAEARQELSASRGPLSTRMLCTTCNTFHSTLGIQPLPLSLSLSVCI